MAVDQNIISKQNSWDLCKFIRLKMLWLLWYLSKSKYVTEPCFYPVISTRNINKYQSTIEFT